MHGIDIASEMRGRSCCSHERCVETNSERERLTTDEHLILMRWSDALGVLQRTAATVSVTTAESGRYGSREGTHEG